MIVGAPPVYFWCAVAIICSLQSPGLSFRVQQKSSRPTTRLHQDSLLQEWWKAGSNTILAANHAIPTTVLFDWNKKDTNDAVFHLLGGAAEVQHRRPAPVSVVALPQPKERRRRLQPVDDHETTAPGLGTFEFDEEEDEEEDAMLNAQQQDAEQVLSQRNRTRVAIPSGLPTSQQKKRRSLLDTANPSTNRNTTTTLSKKRGKTKSEAKARDSLAALLKGKKSTDVLTVADMERILESQLVQQSKNKGKNLGPNAQGSSGDKTAFPQPSDLSDRTVQWGTTAAAGFFGLILAASALPNLWLAGCVAGSVYGYGVKLNGEDANTVSKFCTASGKQLARTYLRVYDAIITLVFLYKTGQLSYTYYQKYQDLDQRFGIQRKMDAWNARFAQGKRNFDAWERENEIGRKALAALRTAWLVEEEQHRRRIPRVVQYAKRFLTLRRRTPRWVTAVVSAAAVGIVWAIVPASVVVGLFLVLGLYVWPTWLTEFGQQWRERFRDDSDGTTPTRRIPQQRSSPTATKKPAATAEQHYYRRSNGQRKYYRVGQPAWPWQPRIEELQQQQRWWWLWWKRRGTT